MNQKDNKDSFTYTYSAKEQAEIKKIRERYVQPQDTELDKMEQLKRLDAGVTKKGSVAALTLGTISAIVLGSGMSLIMTDIGEKLGMAYDLSIVFGIVIGVIGIFGIALAYPLYNRITRKEKERIAPEIIRLTDELLK